MTHQQDEIAEKAAKEMMKIWRSLPGPVFAGTAICMTMYYFLENMKHENSKVSTDIQLDGMIKVVKMFLSGEVN